MTWEGEQNTSGLSRVILYTHISPACLEGNDEHLTCLIIFLISSATLLHAEANAGSQGGRL